MPAIANNRNGLGVVDILIILVVLAVLIFASVQEFGMYEDQVLEPAAPTPAATESPA